MIATQTWSDMIMYLQSSRWSSLRMCQGRIHCGIWGPELSSVFFWGSCETVRRMLCLWQSQLIICWKNVIGFYLQFRSGDFPKLGKCNSQVQLEKKEAKKWSLIWECDCIIYSSALFYVCSLKFFITGAYGRFIKTNSSILTITRTIAASVCRTCFKMNNLKSF